VPPEPRVLRVVLALAFAGACAALPRAAAAGAVPTPRQQVEERLMCYCGCADLTVRVCTCGTADAIRREIDARLENGETPDQVVAAYVSRHGAQIRSAPSKAGFELLAWITPFAAILLAGSALVIVVRRWGRRAAAGGTGDPSGGSAPAPFLPEDQKALERVRREMREER
jgi:cytochrome c-type biogenesis protein CcmH